MKLAAGESVDLFTESGKQLTLCVLRADRVAMLELPGDFVRRRGVDLSQGRIVGLGWDQASISAKVIVYKEGDPPLLSLLLAGEALEANGEFANAAPGGSESAARSTLAARNDLSDTLRGRIPGEARHEIEAAILRIVKKALSETESASAHGLSELLAGKGFPLQPHDLDYVLTRHPVLFRISYKGLWHLA